MKRALLFQLVSLKLAGLGLMLLTDYVLLGACVFLAGGLSVVVNLLYPRAQGLCDVVTGFRARGQEVWLTIDDGPDPEDTPRILDLLDAHGAKATFFMIGVRAERHPGLVREVLARGHAVGSHTHTHPLWSFWYAGRERVRRELDLSLAVLNQLGAQVQVFRSPVGIKNLFLKRILETRGLHCIAWSIRSGDGYSDKRETIIRRVLDQVRPGSIILMHEGTDVASGIRVEAMGAILEALSARQVRCVIPSPDSFACRRT